MTEQAHARRSDPATSHEAADAVTPELKELQALVEQYALTAADNGFTDASLEEFLGDAGSTYRTRRAELTARNIILNSGQTRTFGESTRQRIVWVHRRFVLDAPPICEPPTPASPEDRNAARAKAARFDEVAKQMDREGRIGLATEFREGAALLRKLIA